MRQVDRLVWGALFGLALTSAPTMAADNALTKAEKADGWKLLFNGKDHTGWKCNNGKPIASPIEDGALMPYKSGGYLIIHEKPVGDFVLKCDVKMEKECNSGIFFRVGDPKDPVYTGFEMQVFDGKDAGYHDFGALYDIAKPTSNRSKGVGKWDAVEITCRGPHIMVAVNGQVVTKLNCDELDRPGKRKDGTDHKFKKAIKDLPRKGYFGFQDHGHKVWFKNVKLKEL